MRLHHTLAGSGPHVLFFNGSGATLEGSAPIIDGLRGFATVLAHDQRGLGKTGIIDGPYTMSQYAQDGADLLDHVGWDTCIVIGIELFGWTGLPAYALVCIVAVALSGDHTIYKPSPLLKRHEAGQR